MGLRVSGRAASRATLIALALVLAAVLPASASARAGDLATDFGEGGIASGDYYAQWWMHPLAIDDQGRAYIRAYNVGPDDRRGIIRLQADGSPDLSFGGGDGCREDRVVGSGPYGEYYNQMSVWLAPSGDLVSAIEAGYLESHNLDPALSTASPDEPELPLDGLVQTNLAPGIGGIGPDDFSMGRRGVAAMLVGRGLRADAVVRFTPNGSLDQGFGDEGKVELRSHENYSVQVDNRGGVLVLSGQKLRRWRPSGRRDHSFDPPELGGWEWLTMGHDSRDRTYLAWTIGKHRFRVARLTAHGDFDKSFSRDGLRTGTVRAPYPLAINNIELQGGKRVVLGLRPRRQADQKTGAGFWMAALNARNGRFDRSFGNRGWVHTPIPGDYELAATAIGPGPRLFAVGRVRLGTNNYEGKIAAFDL